MGHEVVGCDEWALGGIVGATSGRTSKDRARGGHEAGREAVESAGLHLLRARKRWSAWDGPKVGQEVGGEAVEAVVLGPFRVVTGPVALAAHGAQPVLEPLGPALPIHLQLELRPQRGVSGAWGMRKSRQQGCSVSFKACVGCVA